MEVIKSENQYNMIDWLKKVVIKNYANFEGRARRSEYWYYTLANILIVLPIFIVGIVLIGFLELEFLAPVFSGILLLIYLTLFIPSLAVAVRRLHDTGKSGWALLLGLIPFGGIVLIVFFILDSDHGDNKWGRNPKQTFENDM